MLRRSRRPLAFLAGAAAAMTMPAAGAPAPAATVEAVPGRPVLLLAAFDLGSIGYRADEYFLSGTAASYALPGPATSDGRWRATAAASARYATRIVVLRPVDPARFNGTAIVEWLNVTGGQDTPADWMVAHREMVRRGYAYVGVSAQLVGVEGGAAGITPGGRPLRKADPQRYGRLSHPGDAFSYDIFSQAGAAVKAARPGGVLGPLVPRHVIAAGESQSAAFLTTYVNAVDPIARVYDGFLIHSRFGGSAGLDGTRATTGPSAMPLDVRFRPDLRVPLLAVITETDLLGGRAPGYHAARQPDTARLRVWEIAGTAHADNYLFGGAFVDSGLRPHAELAKVFLPTRNAAGLTLDRPINPGMAHHYVVEAALAALDRWVATGHAPAGTPRLTLATGGRVGVDPSLAPDANGPAQGGIRTPWVDVPTVALSGKANPGSPIATLVGSGEPFDAARLASLYPGGKAEYLRRFDAALTRSIAAGHILPDDREEIIAIAAASYGAH